MSRVCLYVCVCLHAGGLRGAVWQTEGLGLQLLVALYQDGLRHGRSRGGQPHHWSVPCTEVKRSPTSSSSSFSPPAFNFSSSFALCLSSLLLKTLLTPSEKKLQTSPSQIGLSSKGLFPPSALCVKTEGSQRTAEAKWWTAKRRAGLRCDRSGGVRRVFCCCCCFGFSLFCLPLSWLKHGCWMLV